MLDKAFKGSRKFLGVPIAILLVALIAIGTGTAAYASYLGLHSTVTNNVYDPLHYVRGAEWQGQGGDTWMVNLYACETKTATILVTNAADVPVPLSAVVTPASVAGVTCAVTDNATGGSLVSGPTVTVPAGGSITVNVTVHAACDIDIPPGGFVTDNWTVDLFRG